MICVCWCVFAVFLWAVGLTCSCLPLMSNTLNPRKSTSPRALATQFHRILTCFSCGCFHRLHREAWPSLPEQRWFSCHRVFDDEPDAPMRRSRVSSVRRRDETRTKRKTIEEGQKDLPKAESAWGILGLRSRWYVVALYLAT